VAGKARPVAGWPAGALMTPFCIQPSSTESHGIHVHSARRRRAGEGTALGHADPARTAPRQQASKTPRSSSAPLRSGHIQPDQSRRLLLMIRPPRPTFAEVPLAGLSPLNASQSTVPVSGRSTSSTSSRHSGSRPEFSGPASTKPRRQISRASSPVTWATASIGGV
jgi:hypothetical protein